MTVATRHWDDRLREVLDGRPVVATMDLLVAAALQRPGSQRR